MAIDALSEIDITDADIDEIELLLGNLKFDSQRRDILKCMDSIDIQAFPGSGKTTVLIAKLAILAKNGHIPIEVSAFYLTRMLPEMKSKQDLAIRLLGNPCCHFPISLEHFILFLIPLLVYRGSGPMGIL